LRHFIDVKMGGSRLIERMYADHMPAPFLSVLIDDCIQKGRDYNAGGARYNNTFIQMVGLGSITDCLSALKELCFERGGDAKVSIDHLLKALEEDFSQDEILRQRLVNRTHKYGNDNDYADRLMLDVFDACFQEVDNRPDARGGRYRVEMLPTTCHVYFGSVTGAMPDGRKSGLPLSEGISPVQGADRKGPTGVILSAAKMDHVKTGGTLLNMKFHPDLVSQGDNLTKWAHLVRSYFKMGGHHMQFNVVTAETLRKAQADPENHRDLIVRVAGYSDYFCDLSAALQEEIISRTEHEQF